MANPLHLSVNIYETDPTASPNSLGAGTRGTRGRGGGGGTKRLTAELRDLQSSSPSLES